MFVHGQASQDAYAVRVAPFAIEALRHAPPGVGAAIRKRLQEIAFVAGLLSSEPADRMHGTLRVEIEGYIVTYVLSDSARALTVTGVARFMSRGSAANS